MRGPRVLGFTIVGNLQVFRVSSFAVMSSVFPAEWGPHRAIWLAWPWRRGDWGEYYEAACDEVAGLVRALRCGDTDSLLPGADEIELLVGSDAAERAARRALSGLNVRGHRTRYADIWLRDTGPLFVHSRAGLRAACFEFNGWGSKYDFPEDRSVARGVARSAGIESFRVPMVFEGGSLDVDGAGTALTTTDCLLHPERNPGLGRGDIEQRLESVLGVRRVVWLHGSLRNDHTDGHVDTLARFIAPGRVVCMEPSGADDPNRETLEHVRHSLMRSTDAEGRLLQVETIPSPGAVFDSADTLLPASYVNFCLANRVVVVPQYGVAQDDDAVTALKRLFPERLVVGRRASALISGGGAFHCITREEPAA